MKKALFPALVAAALTLGILTVPGDSVASNVSLNSASPVTQNLACDANAASSLGLPSVIDILSPAPRIGGGGGGAGCPLEVFAIVSNENGCAALAQAHCSRLYCYTYDPNWGLFTDEQEFVNCGYSCTPNT